MYNHQPAGEICSFCTFANGGETNYNKRDDIVFEDNQGIAFVSPKWWINNPGNIIIIPKKHFENIYDIPDELLAHIHILAKKTAIALKAAYQCDGTSLRQHNEPAGNQDMWHFHVHIFPRYQNDDLYKRHDEQRFVTLEERQPYAQKIKQYFHSNK
jgi:histidine triad (HIT) family protein